MRQAQKNETGASSTLIQMEPELYCFLLLGYPELCCDNCALCREMYAYDDEPSTVIKDSQ